MAPAVFPSARVGGTEVMLDTLRVQLQRAVENARDRDRREADGQFALIVGGRECVTCSADLIAGIDKIVSGMPLVRRIDGGCGPLCLAFESVDLATIEGARRTHIRSATFIAFGTAGQPEPWDQFRISLLLIGCRPDGQDHK